MIVTQHLPLYGEGSLEHIGGLCKFTIPPKRLSQQVESDGHVLVFVAQVFLLDGENLAQQCFRLCIGALHEQD